MLVSFGVAADVSFFLQIKHHRQEGSRGPYPAAACGRSTNDRLRRADISFVLRSTEREQSLLWRVATFEVAGNISSAVRSAETSKSP